MATTTMGRHGEIALPESMRSRYDLKPDAPLRLIETRNGILVVPLTDEPMSPELAQELEEWQSLGTHSWDLFPFEEDDDGSR